MAHTSVLWDLYTIINNWVSWTGIMVVFAVIFRVFYLLYLKTEIRDQDPLLEYQLTTQKNILRKIDFSKIYPSKCGDMEKKNLTPDTYPYFNYGQHQDLDELKQYLKQLELKSEF